MAFPKLPQDGNGLDVGGAGSHKNAIPATGASEGVRDVHDRQVVSACAGCGIRHTAICGALGDAELHQLEAIMTHRRMGPRQLVMYEGDDATHTYNVISGGLKLFQSLSDGRVQVIGVLLPGDFLGLPFRGAYAYSAATLSDTVLCQFPRRPLQALFERYIRLQERLLSTVHDDLAAVQEHRLLLGRKTAVERLCSLLVCLIQRAERLREPVNPLSFPFQHNVLANYLDLTVASVSRSIGQLRNLGVIDRPEDHLFSIIDRRRLEAIADGA